MRVLFEQLRVIEEYSDELKITESKQILEEGLTYYSLRQFVTLLFRSTSDAALKKMLLELLKILARLEVMKKPVPTIKKLKDISPQIFP